MSFDKEAELAKLNTLLKGMDVPGYRKTSINWLYKHLGIRNSTHVDFEAAMEQVIMLKKKGVS